MIPANIRENFIYEVICSIQACTVSGCFHTRARQRQDNDKTKVELVHSYDAFHTRHVGPGVKGIIGMHRFNICLVVVLSLSCSGVKTPLVIRAPDLVYLLGSCENGFVLYRKWSRLPESVFGLRG